MREALVTQLEQLSYYQHHALTGGIERPIHAFRVLDVRGTRYFVLSRIQDAGLDFTKRTNFLAHHLTFTSEEIENFACPPLLFLHWDGWIQEWESDPELLENEDWGNLKKLKEFNRDPAKTYESGFAQTWEAKTGSHANAFGLLDLRGPVWLGVDGLDWETVLKLFSETLWMMELRNREIDYHAKAWETSFTTNLQAQDIPNDFRWRCIYTENSELDRMLAGSKVTALQEVRSTAHSPEELYFSEKGPRLVALKERPQEAPPIEGTDVTLHVKAEGVPYPSVEWHWNGKPLKGEIGFTSEGETWSTCVIRNLRPGTDQYCKICIRNTYNQIDFSVRVKTSPSIVRSEALKSPPTDTKDSSTAPHESTSLLIRQILDESKNRSSTSKLWECIETLVKIQEHKSFDDIRPDYLINLKQFCETQKAESAKRIAARCHAELQARARRTFRTRCKRIGTIALKIALTILIFGALWWLFQIIHKETASKGDTTQTAPKPKSDSKSQ